MSNKPRNPSAFPQSKTTGSVSVSNGGMTLRDYFAAEFLPAIYNEFFWSVREGDHGFDETWREGLARDAYALADAMLAEREREQ